MHIARARVCDWCERVEYNDTDERRTFEGSISRKSVERS